MANDSVTGLRFKPLVTPGAVGRVLGVGHQMIGEAAHRLGIEPRRLANGRTYLSFEEAEKVVRDLSSRAKG
jgi:hypothetical protein